MSKRLSVFILCVYISSCSPPNKVAVVERSTVDRSVEIDNMGGSLVRNVQPGDTLYSIAFDLGLNVNDVAAWNNLADTSRLQIGQRLRLTKPIGYTAPSSSSKTAKPPSPTVRTTSKSAPAATVGNAVWTWPLQGKVIRHFSKAQGQQGIDIEAKTGQAVLASSTGEVVYVGNSLKGYGNLVIVKHSETYISAYAHNDEIFVREGEQVKRQQRIGSAGINRHKESALHFQIRQNGLPVNPLLYLPKTG